MKNTSSVISATSAVQTNSAVGGRKASSSVHTSAGTPAVSIKVTGGGTPPTCEATVTDSAAPTVTVSRGAEATASGPESTVPGKASSLSFVDRFTLTECSDFLLEIFEPKFLTEDDVRAYVTAVEAGKLDAFTAYLVASEIDCLTRQPGDPARRPSGIADFTERYEAISAAVSTHLASETLVWLDFASDELEGGNQWYFEIPAVWQVFADMGRLSWDGYVAYAKECEDARDAETRVPPKALKWVAALVFARHVALDRDMSVYGSPDARIAVLTRLVCEPDQDSFFSNVRRAFKIESKELLGITLAEAKALRAHILEEIFRCREIITKRGMHVVTATGVRDDSNFWDFIHSIVEHYVATGELKSWAPELAKEWNG